MGWVNPLGAPTHSPPIVSSLGSAPQPDSQSTTSSLPPLAACGAIASLGAVAFLGQRQVQRKQSAIARKASVYNGQGVFPGGGDGSWREGKKGSFGKDGAEAILPKTWGSGNTTQERNAFSGVGQKAGGSSSEAGGSSLSAPVLALGVAAFVFFLSVQSSNAFPN